MDTRSRQSLNLALHPALPVGFSGEHYDNFVNYVFTNAENPNGTMCRVLRLVGRCVVVFHYTTNPKGRMWSRRESRLSYLHADGHLVPFFPDGIMVDKGAGKGWEQTIGPWLAEQGAKQFKGRTWTTDLTAEILRQVEAWTAATNALPRDPIASLTDEGWLVP